MSITGLETCDVTCPIVVSDGAHCLETSEPTIGAVVTVESQRKLMVL